MDREIIIEAQDLGYRLGRQYLLRDISWTIRRGEHWVLFGLNGSGKTTLLSILAGYQEQTEGSLRVFGSPYTEDNLLAKRRRMGLVSSSFFDGYYHQEGVLEIVLSGALGTLGLDFDLSAQSVRAAKGWLARLHLADKAGRSYGTLSKGEREAVLIARALMAEPEVLILDEPCSGLDVLARERMLALVETLARQGRTIIYVTHYTEEVLPCLEKGALLRQGRLYEQGDLAKLFTQETMSAFLQTPVAVGRDTLGRIILQVQGGEQG